MAQGYVKLARCLLDKPLFQNEKLLKVWVWCLLKATHTEHEQLVGMQKIMLQPGQFPTGRYAGSKELKMNPSTFWKYMLWLRDNESLDIKSNNKYSLVTIINWESYQVEAEKNDIKSNNKMTAKEQQNNTNKNVKNDKNVKKDIYGEFGNVFLTEKERQGLTNKYGNDLAEKAIAYLDSYIAEKGYKSKSHNIAIQRWVIDAVSKGKPKQQQRTSRDSEPEVFQC